MGNSEYDGAAARPDDETGAGLVVAFGRQLKLLRTRAGMDRTEFGGHMGYAAQSIASFEQGRRIPLGEFIDRADEVLDAGGVLKALKDEVLRAQYPSFFRDAARLEAGALGVCVYAAHLVPGLLQTADYAKAVFHWQRPLLDDEVIEQRLAARLARQEILRRHPAPLLSFVIEEVVLHKPVGGSEVLQRQRQHILDVGGVGTSRSRSCRPTVRTTQGSAARSTCCTQRRVAASRTRRYRTTAVSTRVSARSTNWRRAITC